MKLANQVTPPVVDVQDKRPKYQTDNVVFVDVEVIDFCNEVLHESSTPLALGAIAFDPLVHERPGAATAYTFRVSGFGVPSNPGRIFIRNMTDGWDVLPVAVINTAGKTTVSVPLVRGGSVGNIDDGERIYEARVELTSPEVPSDFIQILSAQIVIEHSLPGGGT